MPGPVLIGGAGPTGLTAALELSRMEVSVRLIDKRQAIGGMIVFSARRALTAGYCYSVVYDGKLLVERSRDPECDAARALLAQGNEQ
jgi:heterodisulfide reductase subunit A-like polyferredoxin